MARWRLLNPHYLNVPGTEWEYKETDAGSGKQGRKVFEVPLHMDPNLPADHNYPGEIIVTNAESKAFPRDILFLGEPTRDMEPIDDEAAAISNKLRAKWVHPIESLPADMSGEADRIEALESLVKDLQAQMATKSPLSSPAHGKG